MVKDELGLRERKKLRTKNALVDVALELFFAKGFEATTVEEIAAAVEISPRTFFRYFAGKEDVALSHLAENDEVFEQALRARPAGEPPVVAARAAYLAMLEHVTASAASCARFRATYQLIEATPSLSGRWLQVSATAERRQAAILAEREGLPVETDLRPRLLLRVLCSSARLGLETACQRGYADVAELRARVLEVLDMGVTGLPAEWSAAGGGW